MEIIVTALGNQDKRLLFWLMNKVVKSTATGIAVKIHVQDINTLISYMVC